MYLSKLVDFWLFGGVSGDDREDEVGMLKTGCVSGLAVGDLFNDPLGILVQNLMPDKNTPSDKFRWKPLPVVRRTLFPIIRVRSIFS